MELPKTKTPKNTKLENQIVLIYGHPKVGKSTFCSKIEDALFIATEPGLKHLEVYQAQVSDWKSLVEVCAEIAKGDHQFKGIVIDTVDNAYKYCVDYILQKNKIDTLNDLGFGKGFALVKSEFERVMRKLSMLPHGLFLISHAQTKEIDSRVGKVIKTIPTISDKAREFVLCLCDMILYIDFEEYTEDGEKKLRRVIKTKPDKYRDAGDRTGKLPDNIELDFVKFVEAYQEAVK